mmetsp:Transcript_46860/g.111576  ORF Transcript_46860/g.111576 Transcript_46860/m.111576 type:complete len:378 (-) Transcript_46860:63-1196(-)
MSALQRQYDTKTMTGERVEDAAFDHHKYMAVSVAACVFATFVLTVINLVLNLQVAYVPNAPTLPGVMPSMDTPRIILGVAPGFSPHIRLTRGDMGDDVLSGALVEMVKGLEHVCKVEIQLVETTAAQCWGGATIGEGLSLGIYHGCVGYNHNAGTANRQLDYSDAVLRKDAVPGGLLTRLANGVPVVHGRSDLNGTTIAYSTHPQHMNAEGIKMAKNKCTDTYFSTGYTAMGSSDYKDAMAMLMAKSVDAAWIPADLAAKWNACTGTTAAECASWKGGLGINYTYVHTGMTDYAYNGTTLSISKKGSGVPLIINECIERYMFTKPYYETCIKYNLMDQCYPNPFFPDAAALATGFTKTNDLTGECTTGYCKCPAAAA